MKKLLVILCLFFSTISLMHSQFIFQKTYGGAGNENIYSVKPTSDGGFIFNGNTTSYGTGGGEARDFFIIKTDAVGNTQWSRTYGLNNRRDEYRSVIEVSTAGGGGYMVSGIQTPTAPPTFSDQGIAQKLDINGNQTWLTFNGGAFDDEYSKTIEIPGIGYAHTGLTDAFGGPSANIYLVTTNYAGAILGTRTVSSAGLDNGKDIRQTTDNGFVVGGLTNGIGAGGLDMAIVKYNFLLNVQWYRAIGGTGNEECFSIRQTSDGGYIMAGYTTSFGSGGLDIMVVKLNSAGTVQWTRAIGGAGTDFGWAARQTSDGGYIVSGFTDSYGQPGQNGILVKLNSSGNLSWAKTYGGTSNDQLWEVDILPGNTGFVAAGNTASFGTGGGLDAYLVVTDNNGNCGCNEQNVTPTVTNVTPTIVTTGFSSGSGSNPTANPLSTSSPSPSLDCQCTGYTPTEEITGTTQACQNTSYTYAIDSVRGVTDYTWTVNGTPTASNPGDTSITINSGTVDYQIIVTANFGNCSNFPLDTIDVVVDQIAVSISTADSLLCIGDNTTLNANVVNNQGGVTYAWLPSGSGSNINVSPGSNTTYTVTATDGWGCTATDVIPVSVFGYPTVDLGNDTTYCDTAFIVLDAGNAGATFNWNTTASTQTINASTTGTYWVDVSVNGCTTRDSIDLVFGVGPAISFALDDSLCIGENTNITATPTSGTGPYTYLWNGGLGVTPTINVAPTTDTYYGITVTETSGCSNTDSVLVRVFGYPTVDIGNDTTYCDTAFIVLDAGNPGATYNWNTTATTQTINASTSNLYWVDVNVNGCVTRDSIDLVIGVSPAISFALDDSLCIGENTNITATPTSGTGPYTYLWNGGLGVTPTINVAPTTDTYYAITVTETTGCNNTDSVLVRVFSYPTVNLGNDSLYCDVPFVLLDAGNPGATYNWNTTANTQTINATTTGIYWVDVNTNGCVTRDSIDLSIGVSPTVTIVGNDSTCLGDMETLTATHTGGTPPHTYLWAGGLGTNVSINVSPGSNTTYTVTVTEQNGCTGTDTHQLEVFPYPTVNLGNDTLQCGSAGPINLDAGNAGATFLWNTTATTQGITVNTTNDYWVDVTIDGCTSRDSIYVGYSTNPTAGISGDSAICNGETTTLTASGTGGTLPYSYSWTSGGNGVTENVSPTATTTYTVTVTDSVGCAGTATVLVDVTNYPVVALGNDTIICDGNPLTLDAGNPGFSHSWQDASTNQTFAVSTTGIYWVDVTNNNCTTRDSITVTYDTPQIVDLGPDQWICQGQSVTLSATNTNASYNWSTGASTDQITVNTEGTYWVGVTKCYTTVYDTVVLSLDTFSVALVSSTEPTCGTSAGSITINPVGGIAAYTYAWTGFPSETNPTISGIPDGNYTVTVTDSAGCTSTLDITLGCQVPTIIVNQLVTPNNDGRNDTWIIENLINFPNNKVIIYNRWGNEVYKTTDYQNDWDGISNSSLSIGGDYLPSGTYFYIVDLNGDGSNISSGYIELHR